MTLNAPLFMHHLLIVPTMLRAKVFFLPSSVCVLTSHPDASQGEEGASRSARLGLHARAWRPRVDGGARIGARDNLPVQRPGPEQAWHRPLQRGCHCEHTR